MTELTYDPIDPGRAMEWVRSPRAGAVCLFLGTVRELTGTTRTAALTYEAYEAMAREQLARLEAEARERWSVTEVGIWHRLGGPLPPGEVAVAVAVSAPHRAAAFEACAWLMEAIKRDVPIWKLEHEANGRVAWHAPGVPTDLTAG